MLASKDSGKFIKASSGLIFSITSEILRFRVSAFFTAIFLSSVIIIGAEFLFRSDLISHIPKEYLLRNSGDSYLYNYQEIARLNRSPHGHVPVVIFGGSGMREGVPKLQDLRNSLIKVKPSYEPYIATSQFRTLADDYALLEQMDSRKKGIIIYGITIARFAWENDRLFKQIYGTTTIGPAKAFLSETRLLDVEESKTPTTIIQDFLVSSTYIPSALNYLADRLSSRSPFSRIAYQQHKYSEPPKKTALKRQLRKWHRDRIKNNKPKRLVFYLPLFQRFIELAHSKGYKVLIVDQPLNFDYIQNQLNLELKSLSTAIGSICHLPNCVYSPRPHRNRFSLDDFGDLAHLNNNKARGRYWKDIIETLKDSEGVKE